MGCLILFFFAKLIKNFKKFSRIFFKISIVSIAIIGLQGFFNNQLTGLITSRLNDFKIEELINPASSTGYRLYESFMVIREASLFGHGSGARIHLVDTIGNTKWHHWWSIHNEYIEILHKYGFIGLGIFLLLLIIYFFKSAVLIFHHKSSLQTIGLITFLIMLQHCIISMTSGYIIRDNIVPFLAILFSLVETGWQRRKFYRRVADSARLNMPGSN
jgi:O-antigen ligase